MHTRHRGRLFGQLHFRVQTCRAHSIDQHGQFRPSLSASSDFRRVCFSEVGLERSLQPATRNQVRFMPPSSKAPPGFPRQDPQASARLPPVTAPHHVHSLTGSPRKVCPLKRFGWGGGGKSLN